MKPGRYTEAMIQENIENGYWDTPTMSEICDRNAELYADREALVDSRVRLTFSQMKLWMDRLALGLIDSGMMRDDVLLAQLSNNAEQYVLRFACEKAGIVSLPVRRSLGYADIRDLLRISHATGIVIPWKYHERDHFQEIQDIRRSLPYLKNIYVVDFENPVIQYSSIDWEWEPWNRTEFKELRERENLDEVIAGSRTQFDAQVKLLDYVTKRFLHGTPFPEYPLWDALSILKRIETAGGGGYCLMFNTLLAGMCQAYGWQARVSHVTFHEICEVWNDELGKWIFLDADDLNKGQDKLRRKISKIL